MRKLQLAVYSKHHMTSVGLTWPSYGQYVRAKTPGLLLSVGNQNRKHPWKVLADFLSAVIWPPLPLICSFAFEGFSYPWSPQSKSNKVKIPQRGKFVSFQSHALLGAVIKLCSTLISPARNESSVCYADQCWIIHLPVSSLVALPVVRLDIVLSIPVFKSPQLQELFCFIVHCRWSLTVPNL